MDVQDQGTQVVANEEHLIEIGRNEEGDVEGGYLNEEEEGVQCGVKNEDILLEIVKKTKI